MTPICGDKEPRLSKLPRRVLRASAVTDREDEATADIDDEDIYDFKELKWDVIEDEMLKVRPHVILFETAENRSLSSTHYAQSCFYVFTETTLITNCIKFRAVLEKKRFWEGRPWDIVDNIVWDPKKSTTEKVFKDTAIYWDTYLEYLIRLKNPGAMRIARWSREDQWAALGIWAMFVNGEPCRIPTEDEKRLAIEMGTFLGVSGEFFSMLQGYDVGDQRSEYLRKGEKDDESENDLSMEMPSQIRVLWKTVGGGGWED